MTVAKLIVSLIELKLYILIKDYLLIFTFGPFLLSATYCSRARR